MTARVVRWQLTGVGTVVAVSLCVAAGFAAPSGPVVLAKNGVARATIVVSADLLPRASTVKPPPMPARYLRLTNPNDRVMVAEVEAFSGGTNLARGKPATQSGTWREFYDAARAVDGNTDPVGTFTTENSQIATDIQGAWWEVDLGRTEAIDRVVVWNIAPPNEKRQQGLMVSLLDADRKPVVAFEVNSNANHWEFDSSSNARGEALNAYTLQALQDLQHYLKAATGAQFPVKRLGEETPPETCIYVGQAASRKLGVDPATLAGDEWIVRTQEGDLFLCGGKRFGDSCAVYHFLEDIVGVHWWTPEEETVPARPTLALSETKWQRTPAFSLRALKFAEISPHDIRQRLLPRSEGYLANVGTGDGSLIRLLNRYEGDQMQKHPEWFAKTRDGSIAGLEYGLKDGFHRDLCYSKVTDETVDIVARSVIRSIHDTEVSLKVAGRGLPSKPVIALWRDDAPHACQCPECLALKGSFSDRYIAFINRIAARVKAAYPQVSIVIAAYLDMEQPPTMTKMADNMVVQYAMTSERPDRSLLDPANAHIIERLEAWSAVGPVSTWQYETTAQMCNGVTDTGGRNGADAGLSGAYQMPRPLFYGDNLRALHQNHVTQSFSEIDSIVCRDLGELRNWVTAKLLEDPYQDETKVVDTFLNGYYGPAAPHIRRYLAFVKEKALQAPPSYPIWGSADRIQYLDQAFFERSQAIFGDAERALADVPKAEAFRRHVDWAWLSPTVAFLSRWTITAQEWVAAGKRIEGYPLDHDAILAKYKAACEDNMRFKTGGINEEQRKNHFSVIGAKYVAMPIPEQFKDIPRQRLYDFPVESGEFLCSPAVEREKDPDLGGREVLVVRHLNDGKGAVSSPRKDLFPIRFYNNSGQVPPVREIADMKDLKRNEYAWYNAGTYDGTQYGWRGNCMYLFSVHDIGFAAEGLINLGAADWKMTPFEAWVEMKVSTEGDTVTAIRVARVILLTGPK
ncbi:MAG: DUF4838 domain-containing protein [Armatimonadota bacterium]